MKAYYEADNITLYLGDCREVLPSLVHQKRQSVFTDPPYGINKAEWDSDFPTWWMADAARIADTVAITPGTWNLLRCPDRFCGLSYKWTLSAHLTNGMTRGAIGFGNWIPCVIYRRESDGLMPVPVREWCARFNAWCTSAGVSKGDLDRVAGTSDMGGWWLGLLPHRCAVPTPEKWKVLTAAFAPPPELVPNWEACRSDYEPVGDCRQFVVGTEDKPDHPCPKPLNVTEWFLSVLRSESVVDPFAGSGTTLVAAKLLGIKAIGIEQSERYCEIAANRLAQGVLFGAA